MTSPVGQSIRRRRGEAYATPDVLIDAATRYEDDPHAQAFVASHPDGATLEEVSVHFGLTRERVRQIEERALRSLVLRLQLMGISADDVGELLRSKPSADLPDLYHSGVTRSDYGAAHYSAGSGAWSWRSRPLPVEPYSEHGQRVEAAIASLDAMAERLRGAA